jgi:hypothetical protein
MGTRERGFCLLGAAYGTFGEHQAALATEYLASAIRGCRRTRGLENSEDIVMDYNDASGRTLPEILAVIRKAKKLAKDETHAV